MTQEFLEGGHLPKAESNVIMVGVTIVKLPPGVVLLLQRNFVRGVSLGKRSKGGFGPIGPEGHVHGAFNSMVAESSVRACSRRLSLADSMPRLR